MRISLGAFGFRWWCRVLKAKMMFPWRHVGRATVYRSDKMVCHSVCLQKAGEVLCVDTSMAVDVATKNATQNGITRSYFAGDVEVTIP